MATSISEDREKERYEKPWEDYNGPILILRR